MIDVAAAFQIALAAEQAGVSLADASRLYGLYSKIKAAGKLDLAALAKSGQLQADLDALARATAAMSAIAKSASHGPQLEALLASLSTL